MYPYCSIFSGIYNTKLMTLRISWPESKEHICVLYTLMKCVCGGIVFKRRLGAEPPMQQFHGMSKCECMWYNTVTAANLKHVTTTLLPN